MSLLLDLLGPTKRRESLKRRQEVRKIREHNLQHSTPEGGDGRSKSELEHLFYNSVNDLALSYLQNDNFTEAGELFDLCLAKYPEWGTEQTIPYEYAKYYHNMALVRMYQGRYNEAISMSEKGISIKERTDGKDNSRYWWFLYDLACIMSQAGQTELALKRHLEVLANRRRVCGAAQEVTLQSLYTVGATYFHLCDFSNSE